MNNYHQKTESSLVKNIVRFSHAASAIVAFLLAPQIAKQTQSAMFYYLLTEFSREQSYWGSWGFVCVVILASFFGLSALLQLIFRALIVSVSRMRLF